MTMLDRMRRHRNWLKWSLALVVWPSSFFYIPISCATGTAAARPARRAGHGRTASITVGAFRRAYQQQMQMYRARTAPTSTSRC